MKNLNTYSWILALDGQLVDVAVHFLWNNRTLNSTLATIINRDGEGHGDTSDHSMNHSFTGLTCNTYGKCKQVVISLNLDLIYLSTRCIKQLTAAECYIDCIGLSLVKLAWLLCAGLDVNLNNISVYWTCKEVEWLEKRTKQTGN